VKCFDKYFVTHLFMGLLCFDESGPQTVSCHKEVEMALLFQIAKLTCGVHGREVSCKSSSSIKIVVIM